MQACRKDTTLSDYIMYKYNSKQLEFEQFGLPFNGGLRSDNRWVKMAKFIPWQQFESLYAKSLSGMLMIGAIEPFHDRRKRAT
jgi:hypothetical protein